VVLGFETRKWWCEESKCRVNFGFRVCNSFEDQKTKVVFNYLLERFEPEKTNCRIIQELHLEVRGGFLLINDHRTRRSGRVPFSSPLVRYLAPIVQQTWHG